MLALFSFLFFLSLSHTYVVRAIQVPSIVRSPYFNLWTVTDRMKGATGGYSDVIFGQSWDGLLLINNVTYLWWGDALNDYTNGSMLLYTDVTPTRTIYHMKAGPIYMNVTAFSPIEPSDPVRQSLPFAYLSLSLGLFTAERTNVSIFTSISGAWGPGPTTDAEVFRTVNTGNNVYHQVMLYPNTSTPQFGEQLNGGLTNVVYGMPLDTPGHITQCTGDSFDCSDLWKAAGKLYDFNSTMSNPTVSTYPDRMQTGLSYAVDVTDVLVPGGEQLLTLVWAIGSMRDPAVTYTTPSGDSQQRSSYFRSRYSSVSSIVDSVLSDFSDATKRADGLDQKIVTAAQNTSSTYAELVSLAARAVMGSTELTIANGTDGNFNTSDVKLFMWDIGASARVNPIDTLYTAFPFFLYVNPTYLGYLLTPLLEYQSSSQYTLPYAALDIGQQYPSATGDNQPHNQGLDAHARATNDTSLLLRHYDLLKSWTEFIASYALVPPQNSSTNSTGQMVSSTNLALKGIIGIKAMSEISSTLGQTDDAKRYLERAANDSTVWNSVALASDKSHILPDYGDSDSSWTQIYNLYADRLLGTHLVNDSIYDLQSKYYRDVTYGAQPPYYGLPVDSTTDLGNAAWTLFTAASVTDVTVRDVLLSGLWSRSNATDWNNLPNLYNTTSPEYFVDNDGDAGPSTGAMFAQLALTVPGISTSAFANNTGSGLSPNSDNTGSNHRSLVGPIVGGVVGGVAFLALLIAAFILWRRRMQRREMVPDSFIPVVNDQLFSGEHFSEPFAQSPSTQHLTSPVMVSTVSPNAYTTTPSGKIIMQPVLSEKAALAMASPATPPATEVTSLLSPSEAGGSSTTDNAREVEELRAEMERLRQVVQDLHADRSEPLPGYNAQA
ncbi:unnamed protein product [Somion occarium]|uniref:DUF1793-domain-containing protein n=1 Tax=Somion occarium TaxID=3059160 RepID=A0ABP1E395_9APHY